MDEEIVKLEVNLEHYKELVDEGVVKKMQEVLGRVDELVDLAHIHLELKRTLADKEKKYRRIEYMLRMVRARMDALAQEKYSKTMVERGYYIEGEIKVDK